jgi:hypothetical protein
MMKVVRTNNARLAAPQALVPVQIFVHDLAGFVETVVGRQVREIAIHILIRLCAQQPGHIANDAGRKDSIPLVEFPLGFEKARRLDTAPWQDR